MQDAAEPAVRAPPSYIQEKVHPNLQIDDLLRQTKERRDEETDEAMDLFADFNGLPAGAATTGFYRHDTDWSNRTILGEALQVMVSLAGREALRGKVQCIHIDPALRHSLQLQRPVVHQKPRRGEQPDPAPSRVVSDHL